MNKSLLTLALLLVSTNSYAQDKINQLMYITPQTNMVIDSKFSFDKSSRDVMDSTSQRIQEEDLSKMSLSNDIRFGLGGGLDFGVNITYWLKDETDTTYISTSADNTTLNSSGLEEASLLLAYRIPMEFVPGLSTKVDLSLTPSFSTAESAQVSDDGNKFYGGHRAHLAFSLGSIADGFKWRGTVNVDWSGEKEVEPSTSSIVNQKYESTLDYGLELEGKFGASDTLFASIIAGYKMLGSQGRYNPTTHTEATTEYGSRSQIDMKLKIEILPMDTLLTNLTLGYKMLGDQDITTISSGSISNSYDGQSGFNVAAGAKILF